MKVYGLTIEFKDGTIGEYEKAKIRITNMKGHKFMRVELPYTDNMVLNYSLSTINGFSFVTTKHPLRFFRTNGHC